MRIVTKSSAKPDFFVWQTASGQIRFIEKHLKSHSRGLLQRLASRRIKRGKRQRREQ